MGSVLTTDNSVLSAADLFSKQSRLAAGMLERGQLRGAVVLRVPASFTEKEAKSFLKGLDEWISVNYPKLRE